jgi:putative ABC transport system permease protein
MTISQNAKQNKWAGSVRERERERERAPSPSRPRNVRCGVRWRTVRVPHPDTRPGDAARKAFVHADIGRRQGGHELRLPAGMDTLRQDIAYSLRRLRQAPAFTLVAVATLALGIGANGAIFSVVNAVLLRPLPFEEADRLVRVSMTWKGRSTSVYSPQNFLDVEAAAHSFESLAAYDEAGVTLTGRGRPARLRGATVSVRFFDLLRVRPAQGRAFEAGESEPGHTRVAVLGHRLWRERFGGAPDIVGQTIQLNREPHTVIGVAPAGFAFPEAAEIWTPIEYDARFRSQSRGAWYLGAVGRLAPGVGVEHARQEVATIHDRLARDYPDANEGVGGTVVPLQEAMVGDSRRALLVLLGAVGLVLLIACVNVANLLLARVAAREGELAVRTALGAGRGRLVRQLVTESLTLSVLGGAAGVLLAMFSLDALLALQPEGIPRLAEVRVDRTVVAFAGGLSLLTGLFFGVFPAQQMLRRATAVSLREASRGILSGRGHRLRSSLVIGQVALAMMLLAGAGLLLRSFSQLRRVDPGFRSDSVLTFRLALPESAYQDDRSKIAFYDRLLTRLSALPGVRSAGSIMGVPLSGLAFSLSFEVKGRPPLPAAQQPTMQVRVTTPEYFRTMGIPILRGRAFDGRDVAGAPQVAVISAAAARRHFPGEDPLGKVITIGWRRPADQPPAGGEVVGIVGDVKDIGLAEENQPEMYVPLAQLPVETMDVVLRASVPPRSLVPAVESVVRDLDPELPVARVATLDEVVARSISEPRFYMILLGAFASMAVFLAALGIFGVLSYAVVQRSREIGIRVALGAHPAAVLRMVLGQAAGLAAGGVLIGLAGAVALSRAIGSLLFELSPTDPLTLGTMAVLLGTVALLASYLPARRATRVDPLIALRSE